LLAFSPRDQKQPSASEKNRSVRNQRERSERGVRGSGACSGSRCFSISVPPRFVFASFSLRSLCFLPPPFSLRTPREGDLFSQPTKATGPPRFEARKSGHGERGRVQQRKRREREREREKHPRETGEKSE